LLRARSRPGFEIRVCTDLHLKEAIFDSLFVVRGSANLTSISIARPSETFSVLVDESCSEVALEDFFCIWNGRGAPVFPVQELS
jgi:hypothetical protein